MAETNPDPKLAAFSRIQDEIRFGPSVETHIRELVERKSHQPVHVLTSLEFDGLFQNGGIGTYFRQLSHQLHESGAPVIGIVVDDNSWWPNNRPPIDDFDLVFTLADAARLLSPDTFSLKSYWGWGHLSWAMERSFLVYLLHLAVQRALPDTTPVVAEFHEMAGVGHLTIQAGRSGILGDNFVSIVGQHSSEEWIRRANRQFDRLDFQWLDTLHMEGERVSMESANISFGPSRYLLDYSLSMGWDTRDSVVLPYPVGALDEMVEESAVPVHPTVDEPTVVFFGRLEERKGLVTFCDAVNLVRATPGLENTRVLLLGRVTDLHEQGMDARSYALRELGSKNLQIETELDREAAISLLKSLKRAVVFLGSPYDNFPNTALEMSQLPVRVVACSGSGLQEALQHCENWDPSFGFAPYDVQQAAAAVHAALEEPPVLSAPFTDAVRRKKNAEVMRRRAELVDAELQSRKRTPSEHPAVMIGVTYFNLGHYLLDALRSACAQSYSNVHVVVVNDGSTGDFSEARLMSARRMFPQVEFIDHAENLGLSAARNRLIEIAIERKADYLCFLDADNLLLPTAIEDLERAARTSSADLVIQPMIHFTDVGSVPSPNDVSSFVAIPGWIGTGFSQNLAGDALALFSVELLERFPHPEGRRQHTQDWITITKAWLHGHHITVLPDAAGLYRLRDDSMMHRDGVTAEDHFNLLEQVIAQVDDPRLRRTLWALIRQSQSGFVPDRNEHGPHLYDTHSDTIYTP